MSVIAARKCVRHSTREAVARCPSCGEHFCRECVVEHAGVLLCARCLAREVARAEAAHRPRRWRAGEALTTAACVVLLWLLFYGFGQLLKIIPPKVHEGTVWRTTSDD